MHVFAQSFGVQMVRGPAFVEQRAAMIDELVSGLRATPGRTTLADELAGGSISEDGRGDGARSWRSAAHAPTRHAVFTDATSSLQAGGNLGSRFWWPPPAA
jgi:hypothetical protein